MKASFERLPVELSEEIFSYLQTKSLAVLALVSRSLYAAIQTPLYRHPRIPSFYALTLFVRTLNQVSAYSTKDKRWLWWKDERPLSKDVVDLHITINSVDDPIQAGQPPLAIIISRLITAIATHCPRVDISLSFIRSHRYYAPVVDLWKETFPRVINLVLYLGMNHGSSAEIPFFWRSSTRKRGFQSSSAFWQPYLNGSSFPDCRSFELNQNWDCVPTTELHYNLPYADMPGNNGSPSPETISATLGELGPLKGLGKLESIKLEWPTEIDSTIFAAMFSPQATSAAVNLKVLELRYCDVNYTVMAALMRQCLPVLTHFTLLYTMNCNFAREAQRVQNSWKAGTQSGLTEECHLCPQIREFAKDVTSLKLAVPYVCRELFIDDQEQLILSSVGIDTAVGTNGGRIVPGKALDCYAISQTLSHHRMNQPSRQAGVKRGCKRTIVSWQGLCGYKDTWAEILTEVGMEVSAEWILTNYNLQHACRHVPGEVQQTLGVTEVLHSL